MSSNIKEYILIGGYPSKDKDQHPGGQVTATRLLSKYAKEHSINLHIIDTSQNSFPIPSLKDRFIESKTRIFKLIQLLKKRKISGVIIFSSTGFSFYEKILMSFISNFFKIKSFLFIRSGHFIDLNRKNKIIKYINKILLKVPTYIGAQGTKWVEFYLDMGIKPSRIQLIHNWIDIDSKYKYNTDDNNIVFLFVGWIVEKKGVLDLVDVIKTNSNLKQYTFKFAGEGTLFNKLKKIKEKDNLLNIEFLGWQDNQELEKEYENADAFVLPSYAEGFPNVVLEALNKKMPIISTDVGGIPDSVIDGYNGFIIKPGDKESLYNSIKKIGKSKQLREEFSRNSEKILFKQHTLNNNCSKIFKIFN